MRPLTKFFAPTPIVIIISDYEEEEVEKKVAQALNLIHLTYVLLYPPKCNLNV